MTATVPLQQRLDLLMRNGLMGLALVLLLLSFFLNMRMAFWVSIGIPFAFMGMFIVLYFVEITINAISLFGMIIVVGILVDDAIVVGENIYAHFERGKPPLQAAIDGAFEMLGAGMCISRHDDYRLSAVLFSGRGSGKVYLAFGPGCDRLAVFFARGGIFYSARTSGAFKGAAAA